MHRFGSLKKLPRHRSSNPSQVFDEVCDSVEDVVRVVPVEPLRERHHDVQRLHKC